MNKMNLRPLIFLPEVESWPLLSTYVGTIRLTSVPQPSIRTEGADAMGNAMGSFSEIVRILEQDTRLGSFYIWNIDLAQGGLGNASCGSEFALSPYRVGPESTSFGFTIIGQNK